MIGPLPKCKYGKKRRHNLMVILSGDCESDSQEMTLVCANCGMADRMPATGALTTVQPSPLDDRSADEILFWARS